MQETQVWSLGWEDPLEKGVATHSSILAWKNPIDRGAWWATVHGITKESDTTQWLKQQPGQATFFFFVHASVDARLDCFHFLSVINDAAVNIHVQVYALKSAGHFRRFTEPLKLISWILEFGKSCLWRGRNSRGNELLTLESIKYAHFLISVDSSTLAWKIPWTEEPGSLQSMGTQRVGHDWVTSLSLSK